MDFKTSPFIVIWETTRACALKCVHCRAEAVDRRDPAELTSAQGFALLEEIRRFGNPLLVFTGGDPMRRPDALDLVRHAVRIGLRTAMTPSATPETTREKVFALKDAGLARLAVSLDGSAAAIHDGFRGVPGSYGWTLDILRWAREAGLETQINTTVSRHNLHDLKRIERLLPELDIELWSVFFLVPTGRAQLRDAVTASECEEVFERMASIALTADFDVKSTEAPQFRRVMIKSGHGSWLGSANAIGRAPAVNDGKGFVFVSHTGEIMPSGFLPLSAGNVKTHSLGDVYRDAPLFRQLRDPSLLRGKCGDCEYKSVCGGSRARAYAITGDYLGPDPFCVHVPAGVSVCGAEERWD